MDYTYFPTDWLPYQCFDFSSTPVTNNNVEQSGHESQTLVAERTRRHTFDSFTLQDPVTMLEQQGDTSMAFAPNFLNYLGLGAGDLDQNAPQPQIQPQPQPQADLPLLTSFPPTSTTATSPTSTTSFQQIAPNLTYQESMSRRDSTEEEVSSPRKCRRKAQNREAQRAFRERKEIRIKELEKTLKDLQRNSAAMTVENDRLRQELSKCTAVMGDLCAVSRADGRSSAPHADRQCGCDQRQKAVTALKHEAAQASAGGASSDLAGALIAGKRAKFVARRRGEAS